MKEENYIECPSCAGSGWEFISCCGDDILDTEYEDFAICPTCKEHQGEREPCSECDGKGYLDPVEVEFNRAYDKADRQNKQAKECAI